MIKAPDNPKAAMARNLRRIQTEGLDRMVDTSFDILKDKTAPAAAKASVINTLSRMSGLLEQAKEGAADKELHELTADELEDRIADLRRQAEDKLTMREEMADHEPNGDDGIFG